MKKIVLAAILAFLSTAFYAQSPTIFNYQAVARDASGGVLPNEDVGVRISVLSGSATGTTEFSEEHAVSTNAYGLFNFRIGEGTNTTGDLGTIDWSSNDFFIKVEFDAEGGTNFIELSTTQLVSVPFSLFANNVLNDKVNDADADPNNEIQVLSISNDSLLLSNSGSLYIGNLINQANHDNDSINEIQTVSISNDTIFLSDGGFVKLPAEIDGSTSNEIQGLSFTGDTLYLTDGGSVYLGGYVNELNNDNDSTNEIQTVTIGNDTIYLSNGGFVKLPAEVDGSITNEIQAVSFSGDTLYLSDGGNVYLGAYVNDLNNDNDSTNEIQAVSFSGDTLYLSDGGNVYLGAYNNVANNDNDSTNEIQAISLSNDTIYLSNGGFVKLPAGFDGQYSSLTGAPTNVSSFTNDSGYLTSEIDGSTTNEIQALSISNDTVYLSDGGFVKLPVSSGGLSSGSAAGNTPYWDGSNWVTNSSNIHNNGGNIGIGSTTPGSKVTVGSDFATTTGITVDGNNDGSSQIILRRGAGNNALGLLAWNTRSYFSSGAYYDGGAWVHHNSNNNNQILELIPGNGVRWYASDNGSASFNVTNSEMLWTDEGTWNNQIQSTASGASYINGGNVGLGTTSPDNKLHVEDLASNHVAIQIENNDAIGGIEFESQGATAVGEAIMNVGIHTNRGLAEKGTDPTGMWMRMDSRSSSKSFDWYMEEAGSNAENHLMKLNSAGNLTINNAYTLPNADGSAGQVLTTDGSGAATWQAASGGDNDWTVSGSNMYAGVTGNVGIGNTSPAAKLTIGNNIASGGLDNYSEYQLVLYQTASAVNAYGMGIRGGTFVINTDDKLDLDVDGQTKWRFHSARLEPLNDTTTTAIGYDALLANTASSNTAVGHNAAVTNTTGTKNTAIGVNTLAANTAGNQHTAVGHGAGNAGVYTTTVGHLAGASNTAGYTTAIGDRTLTNNTTGNANTAVGGRVMQNNTTGSENVAMGYGAAYDNTVGDKITAIGFQAANNTTSSENTAIGHKALFANTTGTFNVAVGDNAGNAGNGTTSIGHDAGSSNTANATIAIGDRALASNTSGNGNTAVGFFAGNSNTTGSSGTYVGYLAGRYSTASDVTAIGAFSLDANTTGTDNTGVGKSALGANTTGSGNTALGDGALAANTTSNSNTAIGRSAMPLATGGTNTGVGFEAFRYLTTGEGNSALGRHSGLDLASGNYNIFLGRSSGNSSATYTRTNMMCLGYNTAPGPNNSIRLGNSGTSSIGGYAAWSNLSDGRFKKNIHEDVPGLDFVKGLRPVTYEIDVERLNSFLYGSDLDEEYHEMAKAARNGKVESGFIAQEVEALADSLGYKFSGVNTPESAEDHYSLAYSTFVVPLVKATQEQQAIIENQQSEIDELRDMINELRNKE